MRISFIVFLFLFISCKNEVKKEDKISPKEITENVQLISNPTTVNSSLPRLFSNGESLFLSYVTQRDSLSTLYYSEYKSKNWQEPIAVSSGTDWFINWADFPVIAENKGTVLTSHLQKSAKGTYTYNVKLDLYNSEEESWKNDFLLHNDGTKSEHGFVSMIPNKKGFFVTWLDGRNTVGGGHENHDSHNEGGAMTLRAATVNFKGEISNDTELDNSVCDCCGTSSAMTTNGPIVAYRDRSKEEIRDISVIRFENEEPTKSQTIGNDNWEIPGCPVNGPSIAALENSVAVGWFTAVGGEGKVQIAFSEDNGKNFGSSIRVDTKNATGRVEVEMISDKEAVIIWMEPNGEEEVIKVRKIAVSGEVGAPIIVSKTSAERASGFPQTAKLGDKLFFAWTQTDSSKVVRTAQLDIKNL
ncbi:hypothetical protein [Marixanthomonas ophiurae]|uniref:Exo-alpha-sialidase n=1 Tax=Marixanthomonas ophiurae TaxID=387659 RepID=A0A3E1Q640_9FLAO|nr:hypothetical protein [Marixanthomonas ophiurae]RFN57597.1 hypothetical protein DZ858_14870 [Marixanthomonas ophiurae]